MSTETILFALRYIAFMPAILLISVAIHEAAHLLAARALRIPATEFAIGFGPTMLERRTRAGLWLRARCFPLGGYVRLDERLWLAASLRTRILIMLAGIAANFALASAFMFVHTIVWPGAVALEDVYITDTAIDSTFRAGDRIVAANNKRLDIRIDNARQMNVVLRISEGLDTTFIVERDSRLTKVRAVPLMGGIEGVHNTATFNYRSTQNPRSIVRAGEHALLFNPVMVATTIRSVKAYFQEGTAPEITGIIGIAKLSGQIIELTGASYALIIAASLNFSIATLNLLPLPILDGGKMLIALIERASGRRLKPNTIQAANYLSIALIIAALTFTLIYDLNSHIF